MGIDCVLKVNGVYICLDRWYIFCPPFVSGIKYGKQEALNMIYKLQQKITEEKPVWGDGKDRLPYFKHWYKKATEAIEKADGGFSTSIIFYHEHDAPREAF